MDKSRPLPAMDPHFENMANSLPVMVWIAGTDRLHYFFNVAWLRFTGRSAEQEQGNGWLEGLHPDDRERVIKYHDSGFDARTAFTLEYRLKKQDGQYHWLLCNATPKYTAHGEFVGFVGTCTDVNALLNSAQLETADISANALKKEQQLNEELAASNEEMAAANEELLASNEELVHVQDKLSTLNEQLEELVASRTKALSKSESRFRFLIKGAPVAIASLKGRELVIESANELILRLWGKTKDIIGQTLATALPEIKGQPFLQLLDNVYTSGKACHGNEVKALIEHEGTLKTSYFNFIYKPMSNLEGLTDTIIVIANEVTEQVLARQKVEASQYRLNSMVTTAPIAMTILQGRALLIEIVNQPMLALWSREAHEVLGKNLLDVFPELRAGQFPGLLESVFETGRPVKMPEVLSPHGDQTTYIDFSYDPLFDNEGQVESVLVTVKDITAIVNARKLVEQSEQDLQAMNEELSAINEELLASNEELVASNENLERTQYALQDKMMEVKANEAKFSFMLNAIPQQVWMASPDGKLTYVNDVVCNDFGHSHAAIIDHGWKVFIHPDDRQQCLAKWFQSLQTGNEYMVEFRLLFNDGQYYWHLGRAIPFREEGTIKLWIGTNTNIQVQKENEDKKDEFISIASHELKTPLTSIKGFTQLMLRAKEPERVKDLLAKSADQIKRLEKLIAELLDVTKINAGKLTYHMESFDFRQMIHDSIEVMQHTAKTHEIVFNDGPEIAYVGDRFRLEQVVHNFLSNAIKYSPTGNKVIINCAVNPKNIVVSIQDFGIGIAQKNLGSLFERYYRVDQNGLRFDGLGLGLFISSEILKRHQGSFWVESEQGKGSTFYFELPLAAQQNELDSHPTAIN